MKRLLDKIEVICAIAFATVLLIAVSPLLIIFLVIYGLPELYAYAWSKIRKDPRPKIFVDELNNDDFDSAHTIEQFEEAFDTLTVELAQLVGGKLEHTTRLGHNSLNDGTTLNWRPQTLSRVLINGVMRAEISFVYGVHSKMDDEFQASMENGDDQLSGMPPFTASVFKDGRAIVRDFAVASVQSALFFIAIMKNDFKYNSSTQQLWAHLNMHNVWLVRYSNTKSNYGTRKEYSKAKARRFWFDGK